MKIIARDEKGVLVHMDPSDLMAVGIYNSSNPYAPKRTPDAEATTILANVIAEHEKATRLVLAYGNLPTILQDGLKKLNEYAEARTKLVLAHLAESKAGGTP